MAPPKSLSTELEEHIAALSEEGKSIEKEISEAREKLRLLELEGVSALDWLNHGQFELKGITEPVEICEVRVSGAQPQAPDRPRG